MLKTYKIRSFKNGENKEGKPFMNYSITIPANIAEVLPNDVQFTVELTEDGLLFRKADAAEEAVTVPSWAQGNGSGSKTTAKPAAKTKPAAKRSAPSKAKASDTKPATETKAKAGARKRPAAKAKAEAAPATEKAKASTRKRPAAKAKPAAAKASGGRKRPGAKAAA
jgi:hypothetical protein